MDHIHYTHWLDSDPISCSIVKLRSTAWAIMSICLALTTERKLAKLERQKRKNEQGNKKELRRNPKVWVSRVGLRWWTDVKHELQKKFDFIHKQLKNSDCACAKDSGNCLRRLFDHMSVRCWSPKTYRISLWPFNVWKKNWKKMLKKKDSRRVLMDINAIWHRGRHKAFRGKSSQIPEGRVPSYLLHNPISKWQLWL